MDAMRARDKESITQFQAAGREDLVSKEQVELGIIRHYLPEPLTETEILSLVEQALLDVAAKQMSDMGKVMAHLKPLLQGRADMGKVSALLKSRLSP